MNFASAASAILQLIRIMNHTVSLRIISAHNLADKIHKTAKSIFGNRLVPQKCLLKASKGKEKQVIRRGTEYTVHKTRP